MHEEFSQDFVHAEMMWRLSRTCKLGVCIHPKFSYLMWSSHLLDWLSGLRVNPGKICCCELSSVAARNDWKVRKFLCQGCVTYSLPKFQKRFYRWFHFSMFLLTLSSSGSNAGEVCCWLMWDESLVAEKRLEGTKKECLSFWANSGTSRLKNLFTQFLEWNTVRLQL